MHIHLICKQDMVLLHHEVEVEYPNSQITEKHTATLLEFGKIADGKTTTAMALTVGIPAAVGALVLSLPFLFSKLL
jgi:alpha-aminoadipic semialdehyde synthase